MTDDIARKIVGFVMERRGFYTGKRSRTRLRRGKPSWRLAVSDVYPEQSHTDPPQRHPSDHPWTDPGDGRQECDRCGKWVWLVAHSCKGVPVTPAALARWAGPGGWP